MQREDNFMEVMCEGIKESAVVPNFSWVDHKDAAAKEGQENLTFVDTTNIDLNR